MSFLTIRDGHFVLLQEGMHVDVRLEPQELPDFLGGEHSLPAALQREAFEDAAGQVTPSLLQTLHKRIWNPDRDFHHAS
jgi:hypothetical protein